MLTLNLLIIFIQLIGALFFGYGVIKNSIKTRLDGINIFLSGMVLDGISKDETTISLFAMALIIGIAIQRYRDKIIDKRNKNLQFRAS